MPGSVTPPTNTPSECETANSPHGIRCPVGKKCRTGLDCTTRSCGGPGPALVCVVPTWYVARLTASATLAGRRSPVAALSSRACRCSCCSCRALASIVGDDSTDGVQNGEVCERTVLRKLPVTRIARDCYQCWLWPVGLLA